MRKINSTLRFGLTRAEIKKLKPLTTPAKIQDYLDRLHVNFEEQGETVMSPRRVLREGKAHCIEGALLGAFALRLLGYPALLMDLRSLWHDDDHVVAVWRGPSGWGALSKTNHAVLRYREPIYRSLRELAMSFFHEYFLDNGQKTLRSFAKPMNLAQFDSKNWMTDEKDLWYIVRALDRLPHQPLLNPKDIRNLRRASRLEIEAGKLEQEKLKRMHL